MSDIQNIAAEPAIEELETVAEQGMTQDTEDVSGEEEKKLTAEEKIWQEIYEENGLKLELKLTHMDLLEMGLGVMDSTAASLCMDNHIPIHVFGLDEPENVIKAAYGEEIGTIIE